MSLFTDFVTKISSLKEIRWLHIGFTKRQPTLFQAFDIAAGQCNTNPVDLSLFLWCGTFFFVVSLTGKDLLHFFIKPEYNTTADQFLCQHKNESSMTCM